MGSSSIILGRPWLYDDEEEEVYEVDADLIKAYKGDEEDFDQSDLVGVVRCILS